MALKTGSRLGPYEVVGLLDSGAMGEVYRARDPRLEREVAIKVLPEGIADRRHLLRFEQEARAAGALKPPERSPVYTWGPHDGAPYVVSELLEGQTLRARLEGGPLPPSARASTTRGRSPAALPPLTTRESSTVTSSPTTSSSPTTAGSKILDFGLAKLDRARRRSSAKRDQGTGPRATESGRGAGDGGLHVARAGPGGAVDHRSDIFSFGALLYEMLTGMRAFRRDMTRSRR